MASLYQQEEYRARINRVVDFIQLNLHKELKLNDLARVAHFSPFHFHRIFGSMVGETLNQFIQRVRIEKAASTLLSNPRKNITHIALDCGFSSSATFARAFKDAYGMSASEWRDGGYLQFSKIRKDNSKECKTISNQCKDKHNNFGYFNGKDGCSICLTPLNDQSRRSVLSMIKDVKVDVKDVPEMVVAYVRHTGPYKGNPELFRNLWGKLMKWAGPRGLLSQPDAKCLSIYHDDPEITDESNLRVSVCISVPPETQTDGEVGKLTIPAGKYAMAHFEINQDEYQQAWDYVFGKWLPESGYQPDDGPCYEQCLNDPEKHPEHKHIVDICIPVRPL